MKSKGLLFTLFILYWVAVFGVALFSGKYRNELRQTSLSHFIPFGYSMFTPMTKTNFDVSYEFFKDGHSVRTISINDYLGKEFDKGLIHNKTSTNKSRNYFEQIYQLDLAFQKNQYAAIDHPANESFEEALDKNPNLKSIQENIKKFSKLYMDENPSLKADSVSISVFRKPMILPFHPNYKGDYTYVLGDMVFYKTYYIFPNSENL